MYAFDAATGAVRWQRPIQTLEWFSPADIRFAQLHEGVLYVGANRPYNENNYFNAAVVVALDPATGQELWRYQDGDATTTRKMAAGLTFDGDRVLYADYYDQYVAAFSRTSRRKLWEVKTGTTAVGQRRAPTVVDGVAYVASGDTYVYALDPATGAVRWKTKGEESYTNQVMCGRYVVAEGFGADVYERSSGRKVGTLHDDISDPNRAAGIVADGRFYMVTTRTVRAYSCAE